MSQRTKLLMAVALLIVAAVLLFNTFQGGPKKVVLSGVLLDASGSPQSEYHIGAKRGFLTGAREDYWETGYSTGSVNLFFVARHGFCISPGEPYEFKQVSSTDGAFQVELEGYTDSTVFVRLESKEVYAFPLEKKEVKEGAALRLTLEDKHRIFPIPEEIHPEITITKEKERILVQCAYSAENTHDSCKKVTMYLASGHIENEKECEKNPPTRIGESIEDDVYAIETTGLSRGDYTLVVLWHRGKAQIAK